MGCYCKASVPGLQDMLGSLDPAAVPSPAGGSALAAPPALPDVGLAGSLPGVPESPSLDAPAVPGAPALGGAPSLPSMPPLPSLSPGASVPDGSLPPATGAFALPSPAGAPPGADTIMAASSWLGATGQGAPPFTPDPAWGQASLPQLAASPDQMATLSALANLRAQVQTTYGLDLLVPAQGAQFGQIAGTMSARLDDAGMASGVAPGDDWQATYGLNDAIDRVQAGLDSGAFSLPGSPPAGAVAAPAVPDAATQGFMAGLVPLLPLLGIGQQLGIDMSGDFTAPLSQAVRTMVATPLPAIPPQNLAAMGNLSGQLTAASGLSSSLGVPALQLGLPQVQALVAARIPPVQAALTAALPATPGVPSAGLPANPLGGLPSTGFSATLAATAPDLPAGLSPTQLQAALAQLPGMPASSPAASLPGVSLPGVSLPGASLPGASLLPDASLPGASLPGASLPGASLPGASLASSGVAGLPPAPGSWATPDVANAAMAINPAAAAGLNWNIPPMASVPVLQTGMPVASLGSALASNGIAPASAPCAGCDAATSLT